MELLAKGFTYTCQINGDVIPIEPEISSTLMRNSLALQSIMIWTTKDQCKLPIELEVGFDHDKGGG